MEFEDLLDSIVNPVEGVEQSPTIYDDLRTAHNGRVSAGDAMVETLTAENAALKADLVALQAHNYQLLMATPKADDSPPEGESDETEETENDDSAPDAESLFFEEKE